MQMRKATLYTLQSHEVLCTQDFVEICKTDLQRDNWFNVANSGEWVTPISSETLELPIHQVRRLGPNTHQGSPETVFFAVEPALQEVLEAPFKSKLSSLTNEVADLKHQLSHEKEKGLRYQCQLKDTEKKWAKSEAAILFHNSKPWWQRLFSSKVLEF